MNLQDMPLRSGTPAWENRPAAPEAGQYDSPDVDNPEEDLTSQGDFDSEEEFTNVTGRSG